MSPDRIRVLQRTSSVSYRNPGINLKGLPENMSLGDLTKIKEGQVIEFRIDFLRKIKTAEEIVSEVCNA